MDQAEMEREVPIVIRARGAQSVILTGDFTRWSKEGIRLRRKSADEWGATLTLPPGEYQYRLIVDGHWQDDPQASRRVPNPFGSENCLLRVSALRGSSSAEQD
jgi:hypothetical protein